jgi:signal transduction protein with GAF and PtsI domain
LHDVRSAAAEAGIPASVCGEMASDPLATVLLIGLGYERLSVAPPSIPLVKWVVRSMPVAQAREAAAAALLATSTREIEAILRETLGRHIDLRLVDPSLALPRPAVGTTLPRSN